jgi:hypothetical protein
VREGDRMISWTECDQCGQREYSAENPFVEFRTPRPSNRTEMTCVLAGHQKCMRVSLFSTGPEGGVATPEMWAEWIRSPEAKAAGFEKLG